MNEKFQGERPTSRIDRLGYATVCRYSSAVIIVSVSLSQALPRTIDVKWRVGASCNVRENSLTIAHISARYKQTASA